MAQALAGIRVLDLSSGPVGGMTTMAMADFGADVVKIEPPGGDRLRGLPSSPMWLRGKRSVVLDLKQDSGRDALLSMVRSADVVLVSGPPERARRLGADWETLSATHPELVHCSISGWGTRGPYSHLPGYEGLVAAASGRMLGFSGQALRDGPVFSALPVASHAASQGALQGILAALLARARGGGGQRVETSLLRALLPYDLVQLLTVQLQRRQSGPVPDPRAVGDGMPTLNYHPVMTADGRWIQLGNLLEHLLFSFLDATELLSEFLADERFQSSPAEWTSEAIEVARDRILTRMSERTAAEWMEIFCANGNVAAETYLTAQDALDHPDLVASGDVVDRIDRDRGPMRQLGAIAQLSETPGVPGRLAPQVGEHTEELTQESSARAQVAPGRARSPATAQPATRPLALPLAGVTVLEVATIIATPLATAMLADLGARVIKVEAIEGDPYRHLLPRGILAVKTNAGKQSLCLDLKSEPGREILDELAARADVLVHNFRPGVSERLGLGEKEMRERHPQLIWAAVTGYGGDSPSALRPCTHPVAGAAMGGVCLQAGAGMPPRTCTSLAEVRDAARRLMRANESNPDPNTSAVVASALLLALWARERHGVAQSVRVNMLAANAYANADDMLRYAGKPERPTVGADLYGLGAGYRLYRARSGWIFLAIASAAEWSAFAAAAGPHSVFSDARFATPASRLVHDAELANALEALFTTRDATAWQELLAPRGVGCVRADASVGEFLLDDAHALAEGLAPEVEHRRFGRTRRWGPLVVCNGGPSDEDLGPGALAGDHTDELLREIGRSDGEIAALRERRIVASEAV